MPDEPLSNFALNVAFLLRESGIGSKRFAKLCLCTDRLATLSDIKTGRHAPSTEQRAAIVAFCAKQYPFRIKPDQLDDPPEIFKRRLTGAMPPDCMPIPVPIVDGWKNQPTFFEDITNLDKRRVGTKDQRPPGRYVLYFFSKRHQKIVGCNFWITRHDENGIHCNFFDSNDGDPTSAFTGVLYKIGDYAYLFAWPSTDTTELVLGVLKFGKTIAADGASGHLIGVQYIDDAKTDLLTHIFPSRVRLVPISKRRLGKALLTEPQRERYASEQTGVLEDAAVDPVAREFFAAELRGRRRSS